MTYPNKPYINGKLICSAFRWCINLNLEILTLWNCFVVQGHKWIVITAGNNRHSHKQSDNGTTFMPGSSWQCDSVTGLTWQATDIHLLQVLGLQNDHGQFASSGHIPQRETDVTQLLLLWVAERSSIRDIIVKVNRKTEPENLVKCIHRVNSLTKINLS